MGTNQSVKMNKLLSMVELFHIKQRLNTIQSLGKKRSFPVQQYEKLYSNF